MDVLDFREKFEAWWISLPPTLPILPGDIKLIAQMAWASGFEFGLGCTRTLKAPPTTDGDSQ